MQSEQHHVSVGQAERVGTLLIGAALAAYGVSRRSLEGYLLALLGGGLVYRGVSAPEKHRAAGAGRDSGGIRVSHTITINKPPQELYRYWRNFENLPTIMKHLESVDVLNDRRSHWTTKGPMGSKVEWDAEIVQEIVNELITWQSLETADVRNAGSVSFRALPDGRGTELKVVLRYDPPGGMLGAAFAKLFGEDPSRQVREDLQRFKQLIETGETAAVEGQPSGHP